MPRNESSSRTLPVVLDAAGAPLRRQLADGLRIAIEGGRLAAGCRLPSTRLFAVDLGVSRGVVTDAYAQLAAEGLITQRHGVRPVVREQPAVDGAEQPSSPRWQYDLTPNAPDLGAFPRRAWIAAVTRALEGLPAASLDYGDPRGPEAARHALAGYLARTRGAAATADRVLMLNGFTQALAVTCRTLVARGARRLAIEDPSLDDAWETIRRAGLELVPVPVDRDGLRVDVLASSGADAVLVTPAHQFPTGVRLTADRRRELVAWSAAQGSTIIEDDYDGEHGQPGGQTGVLQALAPDRVVLIGSASKTLAPALRLGWLVAPAGLAAAIADERWYADSGGPALDALALGEMIERGDLERHLRRTRRAYLARRRALAVALTAIGLGRFTVGAAIGLHLCVELPDGVDDVAVARGLQEHRINVRPLSAYRLAHPGPPGLVIGYGRLHEAAVPMIVAALRSGVPA